MQGQSPAPTAAGSLAKTPFPHLLVYALERRLSGSFELAVADAPVATLLVVGGCPAKVRTTDVVHPLGTVLAELGMITPEQLEASAEQVEGSERLQGQLLIEMGAIDAGQLEAGLRAQVERKLEHLFGLGGETTFAYWDGVDLLQKFGGPPTPIDPFPVLWRGVRNTPPWEQIDATLQRVSSAQFRPSAIAQFERFAFGAQELQAVERLKQKPARVIELTSILGPSVGQIFVYLLTIMKQVELLEAPSAPAPVPSPSSASRTAGPGPASAPLTGQAFARVQLQQKPAARALVVEEYVAPMSSHDGRASSPGFAPPVSTAQPKASAFGPAPSEAPVEPPSPAPPAADTAPDIGALISNTVGASEPPPAAASAPAIPVATTAPAAAPALTPEQEMLRARILQRAEDINGQDYFQMLGVGRDATAEVIQKTFIGLAKVWHPDRLPAALADTKDACSKVFSLLTEAHATLTDPVKRNDYMTLLKDGGATPDDQAKIQMILEAATEFQKADILLKRNLNDPQAYAIVKRCVELDDHQTDYLATLAWLEAQRPEWHGTGKTLEKVAVLDGCIEKTPNSERALFYRAMLYKRIDQPAKALKDFKKVAELNPRNLDAVREVRLHNMRSGGTAGTGTAAERSSKPAPAADKKGGGLFGKLFKK